MDENGLVSELDSLYAYLAQVEAPRDKRGKQYSLATLLVLMVLAKLGGEDTPSGITDWVSGRREMLMELEVLRRAKAFCHRTYRRVLQDILDSEELMSTYHQRRLKAEQEIVFSLDGKALRGTIRRGKRGSDL